MARHLSAEKLARFREGGLRRAAARRVAAHLDGCARCQAERDALAGVTALLAGTALPPIPAHLSARIETALAAESAQRAAAAPAAPHRSRRGTRAAGTQAAGTRAAARRAGPRPAVARRAVVAAAVLVVVGGGGFVLARQVGGPGGSTAASSPAAGAAAPAPSAVPGGSSSALNRGVARTPEGVEPGAASAVVFGPPSRYRAGGHSGLFTPVRTTTDYLPGQVGMQAARVLAAVRAAPGRPGPAAAFPGGTLSRLPGCVSQVAGTRPVLLVDLATYQGAPATIIVTGAPSGTGAGTVWVTGPGCSAAGRDLLVSQPLP